MADMDITPEEISAWDLAHGTLGTVAGVSGTAQASATAGTLAGAAAGTSASAGSGWGVASVRDALRAASAVSPAGVPSEVGAYASRTQGHLERDRDGHLTGASLQLPATTTSLGGGVTAMGPSASAHIGQWRDPAGQLQTGVDADASLGRIERPQGSGPGTSWGFNLQAPNAHLGITRDRGFDGHADLAGGQVTVARNNRGADDNYQVQVGGTVGLPGFDGLAAGFHHDGSDTELNAGPFGVRHHNPAGTRDQGIGITAPVGPGSVSADVTVGPRLYEPALRTLAQPALNAMNMGPQAPRPSRERLNAARDAEGARLYGYGTRPTPVGGGQVRSVDASESSIPSVDDIARSLQ